MGPPTPQRIPWRVVVEWCAYHGGNDDDVSFLDACFAAMDTVFFEHHVAQARNARGNES